MFRDAWRVACRLAFAAGVALSILAVLELFRIFVFFYRIAPFWGWSYLVALAAGLFVLVFYVRRTLARYPKILKPPDLPELDQAGHAELRAFSDYLCRYLHRLSRNRHLEEEHARRAREQARAIEDELNAHPLNDDMRRLIAKADEETIRPALSQLRELANKEIRTSVRDVMLGVTLSPYHTIDLVIVLYRNGAMVLRIVGIYASRPNTREQLLILRDVLRVVVTVNFLYVGRNLLENLFANVPVIGKVVDDIGQGLGAGLFTSAAGHAAIGRCAAYRGWNKEEAAETLATQTRAFLVDVRDIFVRDVFPNLRNRIRSEVPDERVQEPGFWDRVAKGITTSVDKTAGAVGNLIVRPAVAGTRGVARAGSRVFGSDGGERERSDKRHRRKHRRRRSLLPRLFSTIGQRLKYGRRPP